MTRKERLREKARTLLEKNFITGKWVRTPDGNLWSPSSGRSYGKNLTSLREFLSKYPNPPECQVCAEGAIFLACASDTEATEQDLKSLFMEIRRRSRSLFGESIITVNDIEGKENALKLFTKQAKEKT